MGAVKILPTKECSKCGKRKTFEHFYLKNFKPNGWCKDCYKARHDLKMRERNDDFMKPTTLPTNPITRLITAPHAVPKPAPKPSQDNARELTQAEKAARYDAFRSIRANKKATLRQIAHLNRQLDALDLEENKVLDDEVADYRMIEQCGQCYDYHRGPCNA